MANFMFLTIAILITSIVNGLYCPAGSYKAFSNKNDIGGCGMNACDQRVTDTIEACRQKCIHTPNCKSISWEMPARICTLYTSIVPNNIHLTPDRQIFCILSKINPSDIYCPEGSIISVNSNNKALNDIPGCGMTPCTARKTGNIESCQDKCHRTNGCKSFSYHFSADECTLYTTDIPTNLHEFNKQIFCKLDNNNNKVLIPFVRWKFNDVKQRIYLSRGASSNYGGCAAKKFQIRYFGPVNAHPTLNGGGYGLFCGLDQNGNQARNDFNINKVFYEKTLEVYALFNGGNIAWGGGAFGLNDRYPIDNNPQYIGRAFDSIVYSECANNRLMAGSEFHLRSNCHQYDGKPMYPTPEWPPQSYRHVVIVYKAPSTISIYLDGELYTTYKKQNLITFTNQYRFLFCERHGDVPGGTHTKTFQGFIKMASIFDYALDANEVYQLYNDRDVEPYAAEICDSSKGTNNAKQIENQLDINAGDAEAYAIKNDDNIEARNAIKTDNNFVSNYMNNDTTKIGLIGICIGVGLTLFIMVSFMISYYLCLKDKNVKKYGHVSTIDSSDSDTN